MLAMTLRLRSSFPRRGSLRSMAVLRKRTSPTLRRSTTTASATSLSVKTEILRISPSDTSQVWYHSLKMRSASSPSNSASTTVALRAPNPSPPRGTLDPSSGPRKTARLTSLVNSTRGITKVVRQATMLLIVLPAGTCWNRSRNSSSTPTSTARPGKLKNEIIGFLLSLSTLLLPFHLPLDHWIFCFFLFCLLFAL